MRGMIDFNIDGADIVGLPVTYNGERIGEVTKLNKRDGREFATITIASKDTLAAIAERLTLAGAKLDEKHFRDIKYGRHP